MKYYFKGLTLICFFYLFFNQYMYAQNKKGEKNKATQPGTSEFLKNNPQKDPAGSYDPTKKLEEKIKAGNETTEEVLKYFINESENIKYFAFQDAMTKKSTTFRIDSLLPFFKEKLDSFLVKRLPFDLGFGNYVPKEPIKKIQEKIASEYNKPLKERSRVVLQEIKDSISGLTPSKEKVDLELQYASLTLENKTFSESISASYLAAEKTVALITDPYEKSQGYLFIGNFAHWFKEGEKAMQMYYLGREWIQKSSISQQLKADEEGRFCQNISNLFSKRDDVSALEKVIDYLEDADYYFRESGNTDYINSNWAYKFSKTAYLISNYYDYDTSIYTSKILAKTLNSLNFWYSYFMKGQYNPTINYAGLYSIANILAKEKKFYSSLVFYLRALYYAFETKDESKIGHAISNVAYAYFLLSDPKMVKEYENMRLDLAYNTDKYLDYNECILDIADNFYYTKQYDSALSYLNKIQFDTALINDLYPPFYEDLAIGVLRIKYSVLDSLKSDSARVYEQSYYSAKEILDNRYTSLIQQELNGKQNWLLTISDNNIGRFVHKLDSLKNLEKGLSIINIALRNETSKLRTHNAKYSELLNSTKDSLEKAIRNAAYYNTLAETRKIEADSIQKVADKAKEDIVKLDTESSDLKEKNKVARTAKNLALGLFVTASIFTLLVFLAGRKIKKRNTTLKEENEKNNYQLKFERSESEREITRERELKERKEIELKQLDDLAKNKIHNFQNDFHILPNMLQSGQIESAIKYTNEYGSYQTVFFENWKKKIISLEDEVLLLRQYCKVKEASGRSVSLNVDILSHNIDTTRTRFIQSVFDTLLDNSIRRGFKGKMGVCEFGINITKAGDCLYCEVTDNGIPPNDPDSYFRRDGSGLNILKSRIKAMFEIRNRKLPTDFFTADKLPQDSGTVIKIKMPYEQIV